MATGNEKKTATEAYDAAAARIQAQINRLQIGLTKHRTVQRTESKDWGFAGDLGEVERNLEAALRTIGG